MAEIEIGTRVRTSSDITIAATGDHPAMTVAFRGTEGVVAAHGERGYDWKVRMRTTATGSPEEDVLVHSHEIEPVI